jgi:hypothetical protein
VEKRYSYTLSLTSTLDVVGGQRHAPAVLPLGKTRYPLFRRLCGPQGRTGRVRKISPPSRFDPGTLQAVASRYTNYAIPALGAFDMLLLLHIHFLNDLLNNIANWCILNLIKVIKMSSMGFPENSYCGDPFVPFGQMDGRANARI